MDGNQKLKKPDKEGTNEELLYQNLTRSMMYFCLDQTRCYIRISALSQLNVSYRQEHWITAKGVLRYLKGTWNWVYGAIRRYEGSYLPTKLPSRNWYKVKVKVINNGFVQWRPRSWIDGQKSGFPLTNEAHRHKTPFHSRILRREEDRSEICRNRRNDCWYFYKSSTSCKASLTLQYSEFWIKITTNEKYTLYLSVNKTKLCKLRADAVFLSSISP